MEIILPEKKESPGRGLLGMAVVAAFALGVAVTFVWLRAAARPAPAAQAAKAKVPAAAEPRPADDEEDRRYKSEIDRLEGEIDRSYDALWLAEELGDKKRYMEVVGVAARKNLEADTKWFEWQEHKRKKGLFAEGVKQAVLEEPPLPHFSNDDKFAMLAEEHGITADTLRSLKAEMEVLFADELADKFAPVPAQEDAAAEDADAPAN